jgi:hypothetical protein
MGRQVYFVVSVDLDDNSVAIDDDTFMARFGKDEQVWDDNKGEWREYEDGEYEKAVEILNAKPLENE